MSKRCFSFILKIEGNTSFHELEKKMEMKLIDYFCTLPDRTEGKIWEILGNKIQSEIVDDKTLSISFSDFRLKNCSYSKCIKRKLQQAEKACCFVKEAKIRIRKLLKDDKKPPKTEKKAKKTDDRDEGEAIECDDSEEGNSSDGESKVVDTLFAQTEKGEPSNVKTQELELLVEAPEREVEVSPFFSRMEFNTGITVIPTSLCYSQEFIGSCKFYINLLLHNITPFVLLLTPKTFHYELLRLYGSTKVDAEMVTNEYIRIQEQCFCVSVFGLLPSSIRNKMTCSVHWNAKQIYEICCLLGFSESFLSAIEPNVQNFGVLTGSYLSIVNAESYFKIHKEHTSRIGDKILFKLLLFLVDICSDGKKIPLGFDQKYNQQIRKVEEENPMQMDIENDGPNGIQYFLLNRKTILLLREITYTSPLKINTPVTESDPNTPLKYVPVLPASLHKAFESSAQSNMNFKILRRVVYVPKATIRSETNPTYLPTEEELKQKMVEYANSAKGKDEEKNEYEKKYSLRLAIETAIQITSITTKSFMIVVNWHPGLYNSPSKLFRDLKVFYSRIFNSIVEISDPSFLKVC